MKKLKSGLSILFVSFVLILAACGSDAANSGGESGKKVILKAGAPPASSSAYSYYVALANSVKEGTKGKINVDVVETGASVDNIRLFKRGDIDFGTVTNSTQFDSYYGEGVFAKDEPYKDLRMFIPYSISPIALVVRADSKIESVYDLEGKKFNAGVAGSSTAEEVKLMLGTLGIEPDYVEATLEDAIEMVKNREIVGLAKTASAVDTPDASILNLSTLIDLKVLGFTKEDADKIQNKHPKLLKFEVPANVYENQSEPLNAIGLVGAVAAPTTLSEETAYEMFKAIVENKEMQEEAYPTLKELDYFETIIQTSTIPIHPGVIKYLEENGVEVPEKLK